MRELSVDIGLDGVVPTDVATGGHVDLGQLSGVTVVTLIRHRF